MRQGQPDATQLDQTRVARIQNASSYAQMSDGVTVKKQIATRETKKQRDKRQKYSS